MPPRVSAGDAVPDLAMMKGEGIKASAVVRVGVPLSTTPDRPRIPNLTALHDLGLTYDWEEGEVDSPLEWSA